MVQMPGTTENNNESLVVLSGSKGTVVQQTQADVTKWPLPQGEREEMSMCSIFQVSRGCPRHQFLCDPTWVTDVT